MRNLATVRLYVLRIPSLIKFYISYWNLSRHMSERSHFSTKILSYSLAFLQNQIFIHEKRIINKYKYILNISTIVSIIFFIYVSQLLYLSSNVPRGSVNRVKFPRETRHARATVKSVYTQHRRGTLFASWRSALRRRLKGGSTRPEVGHLFHIIFK